MTNIHAKVAQALSDFLGFLKTSFWSKPGVATFWATFEKKNIVHPLYLRLSNLFYKSYVRLNNRNLSNFLISMTLNYESKIILSLATEMVSIASIRIVQTTATSD